MFPVRLRPEDWTSGGIVWLLDILAPDRQAAAVALASFRDIVKDRTVNVHPIVARSVGRELLEKLNPVDAGEDA